MAAFDSMLNGVTYRYQREREAGPTTKGMMEANCLQFQPGGDFAPWGDSIPSCLANITGFSWNNNLIRLLLSQFYVI